MADKVAEMVTGSGSLQLRVRRFDSDPRLHFTLAFQLLTISENNRRLSRERFPNFFHLSQRFQRRF